MAILRGGTRIFGQDIRIGLPRDNTLTRGGILKRASELPGKSIGASESTIGRFMANIGQGEGMARPTRYLVRFNMPNKIVISNSNVGPAIAKQGINDVGGQELARTVGMMCESIEMPARSVTTADSITYGPKRKMPTGYNFPGEVQLSVFGDKFLRQRMFLNLGRK